LGRPSWHEKFLKKKLYFSVVCSSGGNGMIRKGKAHWDFLEWEKWELKARD